MAEEKERLHRQFVLYKNFKGHQMRKKYKNRRSTVRQPVATSRVRLWHTTELLKLIIIIAAIAGGVLAMILFGFPLIEDLIKGVDPGLRYQKKVESDFVVQQEVETGKTLQPVEMYIKEYKIKNDPYIDGTRIVFTTQHEKSDHFQMDGVVLYDTQSETYELLGITKAYDNLLSPVMSGDMIVLIDSRVDGGGRIIAYDIAKKEQFTIKEFAYAMPELSLSGNKLAFMQWAGETTQRLYVYDVSTREAATVKLFDTARGNSPADISQNDLVWAEYDAAGNGQLKRIEFVDGVAKYANYENFGNNVFEPRTNGEDIVFATQRDIVSGSLMLSIKGAEPMKIAEGVLSYDIGDGYVVYTKDNKIHVVYTNAQETTVLTSDIAEQMLACANGKAFCYYDITDMNLLDEVVWYAYAA